MPRKYPEQVRIRLREYGSEELSPPPPLYHHPLIATSLILFIAAGIQIVVWAVSKRLITTPFLPSSVALIHGSLFESFAALVSRTTASNLIVVFAFCLLLALMSAVLWYAATRIAFGPGWALAVGVCWVTHPSFAFLAQRQAALAFVIFLLPAVIAGLCWWRFGRQERWRAALTGLALGALILTGAVGLLLAPVIIGAMLAGPGRISQRLLSAGLALGCAGLVVWLFVGLHSGRDGLGALRQRVASDCWDRISDGESQVAKEAQAWKAAGGETARARSFLWAKFKQAPLQMGRWMASRAWQTLYSTADGRFVGPLYVLQLLGLVPAVWGFVVALRHAPWRWMAVVSAVTVAVFWLSASILEPLARNLTPVGGIAIVFALIGLADVYERFFHRRLIETRPAGIAPRSTALNP